MGPTGSGETCVSAPMIAAPQIHASCATAGIDPPMIVFAVSERRATVRRGSESADPTDQAVETAHYVRPTFVMSHLVNPIMSRLGGTLVLLVRGRRSGRLLRVPLGRPFDLEGVRYLVSGGGQTHWVRNLRSAGGGELRLSGKTIAFRAVEVEGPERDRIVADYRARQGRAVEAFFRALPDPRDHPVFRVEPLAQAASPDGSRSPGS